MSTPRTIYIRLEGENVERQIQVGSGQQLLIKVDGTLEVKKLHTSEDILVRHHKEMVKMGKIIADNDSELKKKDEEIKDLQGYKDRCRVRSPL